MVLELASQNTHLEAAAPQQMVPNAAASLQCHSALPFPEGQSWGFPSSISPPLPADLQELSLFLTFFQVWLRFFSGFRGYQGGLTLQSHMLDFLKKKKVQNKFLAVCYY